MVTNCLLACFLPFSFFLPCLPLLFLTHSFSLFSLFLTFSLPSSLFLSDVLFLFPLFFLFFFLIITMNLMIFQYIWWFQSMQLLPVWMLKLSHLYPGGSSNWLLNPFDGTLVVFDLLLAAWYKLWQAQHVLSLSPTWVSHFSKKPWFPLVGYGISALQSEY